MASLLVSLGAPIKRSLPVELIWTLVPNLVSDSVVVSIRISSSAKVEPVLLNTCTRPAVDVVESVAVVDPTTIVVPSLEISTDSPNLEPTSWLDGVKV